MHNDNNKNTLPRQTSGPAVEFGGRAFPTHCRLGRRVVSLSRSLFLRLALFCGGGTISFLRHYPPSPPPPTITAPTTHHKKRMPPCFLSPYKPPPTKQGTHAWPGHSRREAAACHFAFSTPHHTDTLVTAPCTHSSLAPFQHTHTSQQPHNSAPCGFLTRAQQANSTLHF